MEHNYTLGVVSDSRYINSLFCVLVLSFAIGLSSCDSDDVGDNYYTFTGEMMGSYLEDRPEEYSEFAKMLDTTKVLGLLNAYGDYTCFAPTNEAVFDFYASMGRSSLSEFPYDTIVKIVYDHIIKGEVILQEDFVEGRLNQLSMSNRYISVSFADVTDQKLTIRVNTTAPILEVDIPVHNGVIHSIGGVLKPTERNLVEAIGADSKFTLFYEALIATNLHEKLNLIRDESYDSEIFESNYELVNTWRLGTLIILPEYKKYGYTALVESDSLYKENGIETLDDLKLLAASIYDAVYPADAGVSDITNPKNSLNRFIAYHLINKQLGYTKFITDYDNTIHSIESYDMYEYIEMMCPNTLLEVRTQNANSLSNMINYNSKSGEYITFTDDYDNDAINGVYHEIDGILQYSIHVASEIGSKRLRIDAAAIFPEFSNNNLRGRGHDAKFRYILPPGYVERLTLSEGTDFYYLSQDDRLADYQGDEIWLKGLYDFVITTPALPSGTYEVRMGYQPNSGRGAAQLYWDGKPCGIPLDLSIMANNPAIGYIIPGSDPSDPYGYENDKMMRNRGYMKGPASYRSNGEWYADTKVNSRLSTAVLRRILGIYTFTNDGEHEFKVKAAREGQFMLDFLEFVPLEVLEREGID